MTPSKWSLVKLSDVIRHRNEFITIDDLTTYKRVTAKLHGKGIVFRDSIEGSRLRTKRQQICKTNDFLVAEIDAKMGGFGIVPEELNGAIVSSHYFLFQLDEKLLDRRFLGYIIKTPFFQDQIIAQGSTNYASIRPNQILDITIPITSIDIQRQIIERLNFTFRRINSIEKTSGETQTQLKELRKSLLIKAFKGELSPIDPECKLKNDLLERIERAYDYALEEKQRVKGTQYKKLRKLNIEKNIKSMFSSPDVPKGWAIGKLGELLYFSGRIGWRGLKASEYTDFGPLFLSAHNLSENPVVDLSNSFHVSEQRYNESPEIQLKNDDILLVKDGAGIGKVGIVKNLPQRATVNSSLLVIRVGKLLIPEFLLYYLKSPKFQNIVKERITGSATPHLFQRDIKEFQIVIPPINEQRSIVDKIEFYFSSISLIEKIKEESLETIEKIEKSILFEAFKGKMIQYK